MGRPPVAAGHVQGQGDTLAEGDWLAERTAGWVCNWREYLRGPGQGDYLSAIPRGENAGRPIGPESFVRRLEKKVGLSLLPRKPTRHPKGASDGEKQIGCPQISRFPNQPPRPPAPAGSPRQINFLSIIDRLSKGGIIE